MKRRFLIALAGGLLACAPAVAHPTDIPFDSFGACTAALNQVNHEDRDFVSQFFPSIGATEVDMLDTWTCQYDESTGAWYIHGEIGVGGNLGNGNGKADPGSH